MSQEKTLKQAQQIAADAGYMGEDALVHYAAEQIPWKKLSDKNECVVYHQHLSEEQTHIVHALKQQGTIFQPESGYYSKDFLTTPKLNEAIFAAAEKSKKTAAKALKAKVEYLIHEKGYDSPLTYAAVEISWKPHTYRKGGYVARYETLSNFDKEVLNVLRMEGHIQPQREPGYYSRDYIANGELKTLLQEMQPAVEDAISKGFSR